MTIRKIATVGNPLLRQRSRELTLEELREPSMQVFIDDLIETMHDANGAGLAAPQIYQCIRVVAVEVRNNPRYPYKPNIPLTVLVNPVIEPISEDKFDNYEGCLSVPNMRGLVERFAEVKVTGLHRDGSPFEQIFRGLSAGTFQHECDHLDGLLFLDRLKDTRSLSTWTDFERFHQAGFVESAKLVVAKYGG